MRSFSSSENKVIDTGEEKNRRRKARGEESECKEEKKRQYFTKNACVTGKTL